MKFPALPSLAACLACLPATAEIRTLVSNDGQSIRADLVSHSGGKVKIRREDGQEFEVDPSIFCKQDQDAILAWMKSMPAIVVYDLEVDAAKKVHNRNATSYSSYTQWVHEISVRNDGQQALKDIKVQYRVIYEASGREGVQEGEHVLEQLLEFNRSLVITTEPIDIYRSKYSRDNAIRGCLVRILDPQGKVITEWVSKEVGMKGKTWENTTPKKEGKPGAKVEIR